MRTSPEVRFSSENEFWYNSHMSVVECRAVLFQEAKARGKSIGRAPHWAAVAQIEKLCAESVFLWDEKPRNGSVDIERYVKHGAGFSFEGEKYVAKITSKVYPGDAAHIAYSVEAISIERNGARGITDSIPAQEQSLDPSAMSRIQNLVRAVKGSGNECWGVSKMRILERAK